MKLVWAQAARDDLGDIVDYIASDNARAARRLVKKIMTTALMLGKMPYMGRPGRVEGTRELIVSGTTYILPYRIGDGHIDILRVYHSARLWPEEMGSETK